MHPRGDLSEQGTRFVRPVNKNLQFEQRNTAFADDMIECTVMPPTMRAGRPLLVAVGDRRPRRATS